MKQVTNIQMGAYIYNGSLLEQDKFRAFQGFPNSYKVWNIRYEYTSDFIGGAVQNTINGFQRGNPMGHRLNVNINLNNATNADTEAIRGLLNKTASRYEREFYNVNITSVSTDTITITDTGLPNNYFKGLTIEQGGDQFLIKSSTATTITTTTNSVFSAGSAVIIAKPSHPTIIGVSFDDNVNNIKYFNLASEAFGINRELTIGNQIIQINLTGVFADNLLDSNIVI